MKIFWSFILSLHFLTATGQSVGKLEKIADEFYNSDRYLEAAEFYDKVIGLSPDNTGARYKQAISYFKSTLYDQAKNKFESLSQAPGPYQPAALYYYGFLVKMQGNFKAADSIFSSFLELDAGLQQEYLSLVKFQKAGCELGMKLRRANPKYALHPLKELNSAANDFGAVEWPGHEELVLASTRKIHAHQYPDPKFGGYLPGFLSYSQVPLGKWEKTSSFEKLNTRWSQGTGSFSGDGSAFYFSECNKGTTCQIYRSSWDGLEWTEPYALDSTINQPGADTKHPFVTAGSDTLFFASNRTGGQGGLDIWMSLRINDSQWTPAINLGERINTRADEITPYFSATFNSLLFASNGHAGYGGFDLYLAKGTSFFEPVVYNLGLPFNSTLDDTYPFIGKKGYVSSNRNGQELDIFEFTFPSQKELFEDITSNDAVIDANYHKLVSLDLYTLRLDDYYGYEKFMPVSKAGALTVRSKRGFININGAGAAPKDLVRLSIDSKTEILTLANHEGDFSFRLSPDTIANLYKVTSDKHLALSVHEKDTAGEFYQYSYEKLYFDYGSHALRKESMEALNDMVRQFNQSNIALIDIQTHSDSRGNKEYNKALSEKRGVSVMNYLLSMGISEAKMRVFAFGEEAPVSHSDSWYARFFNRRAEILIYTAAPVTYAKPEIYLVMQDLPVKSAASNLGINPLKLMEWNGITSGELKEGNTLRIFDTEHSPPKMRNLISQSDIDYHFFPYVVQSGETISSIALKFKTVEELILEINHLKGEVKPGDEILVQMF